MFGIKIFALPVTAAIACLFIWFTVSLVLFIVSKKPESSLSGRRKGIRINFIVSAAVFGAALTFLLIAFCVIMLIISTFNSGEII